MIETKLNADAIKNESIKFNHLLPSLKNILSVDRVILVSGACESGSVKLNDGNLVDINIPEIKEAYLTMGGKSIKNGITPLDRCFGDEFRNNRLSYLPPEYISIEYSLDAGETWVGSTYGDGSKRLLVTDGFVCSCYAGGSDQNQTKQSRVRVTIDIPKGALYCTIDKLLLYISTGNFNEGDLLVEYTTYDNSTFNTMGLYAVKGYSEWNSIPWTLSLNFFGEYSNSTRNTHINKIRLTLIPNQNKEDEFVGNNVSISKIRLFGTTVFNKISLDSEQGLNYVYGRVYSLDINKNVTFPAKVTAKSFAVSSGETLLTSANFESTMSSIIELAVEKGKLLALRELFIAAGASYNDTGADVTKTAPWGEDVIHKAGYYYLNGLGDITEEQMAYIYNERHRLLNLNRSRAMQSLRQVRTLFIPSKNDNVGYFYKLDYPLLLAQSAAELEVITFVSSSRFVATSSTFIPDIGSESKTARYMFGSCTSLKYISTLNVKYITNFGTGTEGAFYNCKQLKEVSLYQLFASVEFAQSSLLTKRSVLYAITNAVPNSAITITLHPDVYASLVEDGDIVTALNEKNGYIDEGGNKIPGTLPEGASINLVSA